MTTERELKIKAWSHTYQAGVMYTVTDHRVRGALANILDGLQDMRDDSALCQSLGDHGDLCDLAARVAAVRMLRRKLADHDLTDAEHAALNALRADTCEWIRAEAGRALIELAEPLCNQDAAHDGGGREMSEPDALAGIPETDVAILAREVVRLREAPALVVPEYPDNDFAIRESIRNAGGDPDFDQCIHRAGWFDLSSRLRAIPADRVLGDGMVQVSKEELEWLKRLYSWMSAADEGGVKVSFSLTEFPEGVACLEGIATSLAALDALRANQGGADHA